MSAKSGDGGRGIVKKGYGVNMEMTQKCEDVNKGKVWNYEYVSKKFGFNRVSWIVKDSCINPPLKDKIFCGPEFYVRSFHLTRWEMSLERSYDEQTGKYAITFCLKRLQCAPFHGNAVADCTLEYCDHDGEKHEIEFNHIFGLIMDTEFKALIAYAGIIPTIDYHMREFKLKLEILVYFENLTETRTVCENLGVRMLSIDLGYLYDGEAVADFNFNLSNNRLLKVHKHILLSRIKDENFKSLLLNGPSIDLDDFLSESVEKVIRFLYTGDLNCTVVPNPSIDLFQFAEYLDVKPIVAYYNPDEITFTSGTDVEEFFATWTIEDFCSRDDFLQSPVMTNKTMDMKWQITVYPKGFRNERVYLDIFLFYENTVSRDICVELFLLGGPEGRISYRCHRQATCNGKLKAHKFIKLENVLNNYMQDDSLTIGLQLRMSIGQETFPVCVESKFNCKYLSEQKYYDHLSNDILRLGENNTLYDLEVYLANHNITLYLNECILKARCSNFLNLLKNSTLHHSVEHISIETMDEVIYFVYSGKLRERNIFHGYFELYTAAEVFRYKHLKDVIVEKLKEILYEGNALQIHAFAAERRIQNLQDRAEMFL